MRLEYIWLDGNDTPQLRSKTRFAPSIEQWNFDGGSTNQGDLKDSDRMLNPVRSYKDPFAEDGYLVLCEVCYHDGTPHESNFRSKLRGVNYPIVADPWLGLEQEVTFMHPVTHQPLGLLLQPEEQGQYYCGVGRQNAVGRDVMTEFEKRCDAAGIKLAGVNAEVMPGQWEWQTPPQEALVVSDNLWVSRYILDRISEDMGVVVSYSPKPHPDYNGAGCHANFSTRKMRDELTDEMIEDLMKVMEEDHVDYLASCGEGYADRMSGGYETSDWKTFTWGVGDRGASVRIPQKVKEDGVGYIEDRRPCANIDPYRLVLSLLQTTKKSTLL
tara:strand:- start:479 stop:1459 length:981 start_codon:yes stop_codon:yes gene_type:complete